MTDLKGKTTEAKVARRQRKGDTLRNLLPRPIVWSQAKESEMSQAYSDPSREEDAYSLPDIEVFHSDDYPGEPGEPVLEPGYYWWSCFPGCLPDSEPMGPFETEEDALEDAREEVRS